MLARFEENDPPQRANNANCVSMSLCLMNNPECSVRRWQQLRLECLALLGYASIIPLNWVCSPQRPGWNCHSKHPRWRKIVNNEHTGLGLGWWLGVGWALTHWGRVTHVCVSKLTIIDSGNGLSPGRRHAITWTNVGILLIGHLGTNFSEMLIEIHTFLFKKIHFKMSSGKWRPFCLGLNVLKAQQGY